jgi:hypothetical protein
MVSQAVGYRLGYVNMKLFKLHAILIITSIIITSMTVLAQGSTSFKWYFGLEGGIHNGRLLGKPNRVGNLPDSIKNHLGSTLINIYFGYRHNYDCFHLKLSLARLREFPTDNKPGIGGDFISLECDYLRKIKISNWLSLHIGPNINGAHMYLDGENEEIFQKSAIFESIKCSASILVPGIGEYSNNLSSFKHFMLIISYRKSLMNKYYNLQEASLTAGINIDNSYIACSFERLQIANLYQMEIIKLIWSGPFQLLP